jgi:UDP-N-acetylmuramate dehydrogenase
MMAKIDGEKLLKRLPQVRGRLIPNQPLADYTWFKVGGPAEVLYMPADEIDLATFMAGTPTDVPIYTIGVGSNLLVRDGGMPGVVIRMGRGFNDIALENPTTIRAGTAALDKKVAEFAYQHGLSGMAFLVGIPGSIGGALRMNGGANKEETTQILVEARAVDRAGHLRVLSHADMGFTYRHCAAAEDLVFTTALLRGTPADKAAIKAQMDHNIHHRETVQPIRERTGGSTFKNPKDHSSWKLIDAAGLRGFNIGPARVSEMHCNFLINEGGATAAQIEELGETVRERVHAHSGIMLEWEIKRIGLTMKEAQS